MVHNCLLNLLNNTAVLCEVPYMWRGSFREASTLPVFQLNKCTETQLDSFVLTALVDRLKCSRLLSLIVICKCLSLYALCGAFLGS